MSDEPVEPDEGEEEEEAPTGPPPGYIPGDGVPVEEPEGEVPPVSAVPGGVVLPSGEIVYNDEEAAGRGGRPDDEPVE